MSLIEKIARNLNAAGWRKIRRRLFERADENQRYQKWIRAVEKKSVDRQILSEQSRALPRRPLISVILPVYDVEEKWLRRCVESVLDQIYENWELCVADDCSPSPHVRRVLSEYAAREKRIKILFRAENGHISAASNSALELAIGEFCALLDHDDELSADALLRVAETINEFPEVELIYSDEDMIDERGARYDPKFKPDWSRDFFYSLNLITHLAAYRTATLKKIGGWRVGSEGSQDYDLTLRFVEEISEKNIRHVPKILYHWRAIRGSLALSGDEKPYAHERAREAIRAHLKRTGKRAAVSPTAADYHRVRYDLPAPPPKVSLIMLAEADDAATERAIETFVGATDYENLEIVLVCSTARGKFGGDVRLGDVKIIVCEEKAEAEKYNRAARQAGGEVLCFVNANLRPAAKDWLRELIGFAWQPEIGAAGAKILGADETIRHGGIVLGMNDLIGAAHDGLPNREAGNLSRARVVNNFSAVAIDCLATRRAAFEAAGGFDAEHFPGALFDADFCLRLWQQNLRVVWTPYAELVRVDERRFLNSQKKPIAAERDYFKQKWRALIERDPFYNPNFSRRDEPFRINV